MTKVNITKDDEGRRFLDTENFECCVYEVDDDEISVIGYNHIEECKFYYSVNPQNFGGFFKKWIE